MAELLRPHIIIDCEQLIQRLTIEKQVLVDENESAKYDDDYVLNECETSVAGLDGHNRRSEKYIQNINVWMAEYSDIKLISNIDALEKRIDEFIDQLKQISNGIPFCDQINYANHNIWHNSIENVFIEYKFAEIVPQNIWNMEGVYPNSVFPDESRVQSFGKWSDFGHSVFDENFRTALFCYQKAKDNEAIYKKAVYMYRTSKKYVSALLYFRCLLDTEQYRITATIYVMKILLKTLDKDLIEFCEQELLVNINKFIPEEIARITRFGLFYNISKADHYFDVKKYLTALICFRKINDSKLIHKRMLELYSKKEYSAAMSYCLCLFSVTELKPYLTVKITKLLLKEFNQNNFNKIANFFKPDIRMFIPDFVWDMNRVVNNDIFYSEILVKRFGDWKATADFYFNDSKYEIALFCYQRANYPHIILEKAVQLLNENRNEHSILYYRYLLCEMQFAEIAALNLLELSVSLNYINDHDLALIASKQFKNCPLIQEYVSNLLLKKLSVLFSAGYEKESDGTGLTLTKTNLNTINSLMDNYDPNFTCDSQNLEYEYNIEEILRYIEEYNCHSFAGLLYEELSKRRDINNFRLKHEAFLFFLRGVHESNSFKYNYSLNFFKEALITYPHKEIITSINKFFSKNHIKAGIEQFASDLRQTKFNFPVFHIYTDRLKSSTLLRTVSKFEKSVNDSKDLNNLEKAMHYIDFTMQCSHPTIVTMNFLISANYLYEEMLESSDAAKLYAYRNTICEFVAIILFVSQRFMDPIMSTHFIRNSISLLYNANIYFNSIVVNNDYNTQDLDFSKKLREVNIIDDYQLNLITFASNIVTPFLEISPIIYWPLTLSSDSLFLCLISSEFCEEYYNNALKCLNNDEGNAYKYDYCLLEGSYKGWANTDKFLEYRENCMNSLMTRSGFKQSQIEKIISWNVNKRDIDGWIDCENTDLRLEGINFDSVEGIVIDINKGTFDLLLSPSEHKSGLFNTSDIVEILSNGISGGLFYLEEPEGTFQCHPFQQIKYGPQSIADTNYLMTLLHADYMLKMITMQTEVCAKWPHVLRDANNGFMKNLPKELRKLISLDKSTRNYCQSHKFWIEAKELPYKTTELDYNVVEYRFNYCPFAVKTDLFKGYEFNNLIEDCNDNGMEQTCDAKNIKLNPEKEFAKNFTEIYDEIGSYFPVFLRLRELLKLNAVSLFLKSVFLKLESVKRNLQIDKRELIKDELNFLSSAYPIYSESKVDSLFQDKMQCNGSSNEKCKDSIQRDRVTEIATHLCISFNIDYSIEMRNNVCVWLENNCNDSLVNYIRNKIKENELKKLSKFGDTLKQLGISTDANEISSDFNKQTCSWIPSVFSSNNGIKVYGGIVLRPNLVSTTSDTIGDNISNDDESSRNHVENENSMDKQANKTKDQFSSKSSCVSVEPKRIIKMNFSSTMDAFEAAKRADDNNEPILHYRDAKHNPTPYHQINLFTHMGQ